MTPDLWHLIGLVTIPNVPIGEVLTVSDAITWPAAAIPDPGHYCLVALVGNARDPAPAPAEFFDWDNFGAFIRANNNVTWRNFNVVDSEPDPAADPEGFVALPFIFPGAPDKARRFSLELVAKLPADSRVILEVPLATPPSYCVNPWTSCCRRGIASPPASEYGCRNSPTNHGSVWDGRWYLTMSCDR